MAGRCFTIGVFQDSAWAARGLEALIRHGFSRESLTVIGKESADVRSLIRTYLNGEPLAIAIDGLGASVAIGPLVDALQGLTQELAVSGIAGSIHRAGFQKHDGLIYEQLTARGGVLISVHNEPRAADALATFHAYGGGNAAIGAWHGRV
jgi:hypothetical protein